VDLGLTGRRVLVLGGTRGLGRSVAETLVAEGATVALTGRKLEDAERVAAVIARDVSAKAFGLSFDATDPESTACLIESARAALGGVDALLLNGGGPPPGPVATASPETWRRQFQAQFLSFVEVASAFVGPMREQAWGRILVSSSSGAIQPIPNLGFSNSLRGGLLGWAKTLSAEVAPAGVTVNTILPGRIQTTRLDEIDADTAARLGQPVEAVKAASKVSIAAGRFGTVEEYAAVAVFLLSDKASYITGSTIRVDGGMIRSI
jgi:3-oxoacyl-[acyl-carrier protein] reductase